MGLYDFSNANWHQVRAFHNLRETQVFGLDVGVMHPTNVALHCPNTGFVACVIRGLTKNEWLALGVAVFFGVHPQHVEAVPWISERKELLSVFYGLQAIL